MGATGPCPFEQHIVRIRVGSPDTLAVLYGTGADNVFTFSNNARPRCRSVPLPERLSPAAMEMQAANAHSGAARDHRPSMLRLRIA